MPRRVEGEARPPDRPMGWRAVPTRGPRARPIAEGREAALHAEGRPAVRRLRPREDLARRRCANPESCQSALFAQSRDATPGEVAACASLPLLRAPGVGSFLPLPPESARGALFLASEGPLADG